MQSDIPALPQWVQIFVALGGGAALVKVWDRWVSRSDSNRKDVIDLLVADVANLKKCNVECETKNDALRVQMDQMRQEYSENLMLMTKQLAETQTELRLLTQNQKEIQNKMSDVTVANQWAAIGAEKILKSSEIP